MASMKGIDISSHQSDLDLTKIDYDFVIIKATQGKTYVNPYCNTHYKQAKNAGKCIGLYHYAGGNDAVTEADYFIQNIENYVGDALLALDWESDQNSQYGKDDATWCKTFLDRVYDKTGVRPLLYVSQSIMSKFSNIGDYGLWVAQYANNNSTGYQSSPWNEGNYTCAIRQYSSHGSLDGYSGNLDLDKFYGDKTAWGKYANPSGSASSSKASGAPTYKNGSTYTLQVDGLRVRTGAGTNYSVKTKSQLTANGQANANSNGTLKKGTKVTCQATKQVSNDVWMQIPSGWVAAYYDGNTYVK